MCASCSCRSNQIDSENGLPSVSHCHRHRQRKQAGELWALHSCVLWLSAAGSVSTFLLPRAGQLAWRVCACQCMYVCVCVRDKKWGGGGYGAARGGEGGGGGREGGWVGGRGMEGMGERTKWGADNMRQTGGQMDHSRQEKVLGTGWRMSLDKRHCGWLNKGWLGDNLIDNNGIVMDHSWVTWETSRMCCRGPISWAAVTIILRRGWSSN